MQVPFIKMHGLGNDFVVLDGRQGTLIPMTSDLAGALADRKTGIGCDQLILLEPSANADFRMRIFNHDGGEVESCGNASRAIGLLTGAPARVETAGGVIEIRPTENGIAVDMGMPRFGWQEIPLAYAMDTASLPVAWEELENPVAINVGNPHVVFFVDDVDAVELDRLGPQIEHDPLFPQRVNVNVAQIVSRKAIMLRVWERGAGLTRACGTGACATAVAAMTRGLVDRTVDVTLPGGTLTIGWDEDQIITMIGPAAESFRGTFDPAHFA
ncbi:MAG TPA: diaminopimelate epimerase [Sphingomonadaceae bacterium]|nr:diaminopimelate epimerase [Sphingomonadaceae bacterium]